ncbi:MAG: DUF4087 domain-containing protein [Shinella sp.]|jgi:hypothetical protein|nr:DUF4087 domain-containing protein [Shinella sp.]
MVNSLRLLVLAALICGLSPIVGKAAENRCGWYQMPTPGNLWLTDKDATWSITSQAQALGPDAIGAEKTPEFDSSQFVETNVPGAGYGYGCACMVVDTNAKDERITRVYSGKIRPLSACRNDKSLPKP